MKRTFVVLFLITLSMTVRAQYGLVLLTNDVTSMVTNGLTMTPVSSTNGIRIALYAAPDGTINESQFLVVTSNVPVGIPAAGRYNGGYRGVPPYGPSNVVMLQVRAYELAYGSSYEAAVAAPPINGRRALVGKSALGRVTLGGTVPSSSTPKVGPFVGPIIVYPVDGPAAITGSDITVAEGSNGTATAIFTVRLTSTPTNEISVDFTTQDGTALAGSDYVPTNGTLVFLPGETVKTIPVTLLPDAPPEPEETFSLALGNPVNASLLRANLVCTIVEVRIYGISIDAAVTFNTLSGRHYLLEKSFDGATWLPVTGATNLLGSGSNFTFVDRGAGCGTMTLYRASLLP